MTYKVLDSTRNITENKTAGSIYTYHVTGVVGDEVVFQGTNFNDWSNPVVIANVKLTSTGSLSSVLQHSWYKIRGVVITGTPEFAVTTNSEVE